MSRYQLVGNNGAAYEDRASSEILLSGPAGTGKTYANLLKMLWFGGEYAGARMLMLRKTRKSLADSAMVTLERILDAGGLLGRSIERTHRHTYKLPRGSSITVGGMDDPTKVLSTEYDLIYVNEATELNVNEWEELSFRLRAMAGPFDQMLADCNPESPHHWLYKRFIAGRAPGHVTGGPVNYATTHYENPGYFDHQTRTWTANGARYMARLKAATGIRLARKYKGEWVSAEGVVYEYDPKKHTWPTGRPIPSGWPRVWGIDWGKRVPTALGVWAVDPEGRMILTREVYQTHLRADRLGARAKKWMDEGHEPRPVAVVCDHDTGNDGYQKLFEDASGLELSLADKADRDKGIQDTQARFDTDPETGEPRIFFCERTLDHEADTALVDSGLPTNGIEELVGYVWDEEQLKDEPIANNDHFCFAAGTMVATARGQLPIEQVVVGDLVLTRVGLRPVLACGMTSPAAPVMTVEFDNGTRLTGTPNHPVWIEGTGFARLDEMRYGDTALSLTEEVAWKSLSCQALNEWSVCGSPESSTGDTHSRKTPRIAITSVRVRATCARGARTSIGTSGFTSTVRFPTGTRSITSTVIRSTMRLPIFSCCRRPFTKPSTRANSASAAAPAGRQCPMTSALRCLPRPQCGTAPQPGARGTAKMPSGCAPLNLSWIACASAAGPGLKPSSCTLPTLDSARTSARLLRDAIRAWTMKTGCAAVGNCFASIATAKSDPAPSPAHVADQRCAPANGVALSSVAPRVKPIVIVVARVHTLRAEKRPQPVFNVTVADQPEFFANGILVHNCDMMRYVTRWVDGNLVAADPNYRPPAYEPLLPARMGTIR